VIVAEVFFVVMLITERKVGNIPMLVNSVSILIFCVLTWRGIPWSRWVLIAFLVWHVTEVGIALGSRFGTGDHRIAGSLILVVFYVVAGLLIASPLGGSRMRTAT
jgi:hypothetical protein